MDEGPLPITDLAEGDEGIVYHLSGGKSLMSRFAAMGIVPGAKIRVLRNSGRLIIVFASDTRVALGRGQGEQILVIRATPLEDRTTELAGRETFLIALAGQPNVGKSTVFNVLTGLSQHIGNWPGKTVERKEGVYITDEYEIKIVDLPGTYSLSAFSEEERVARDFIINEHPDATILLVNASALERSLYLLSELLLLGPPVIVAVNMTDVAEGQGIHIDIKALEKAIGVPVVQLVATKNRGIKELIAEAIRLAKGELSCNPKMPDVSEDHRAIYHTLIRLVQEYVSAPLTNVWVATKLMEGDQEISQLIEEIVPVSIWSEINALLIKHEDAMRAVVGGRYDWIEEVTRAAISRFKMGQVLITDRIDHLLTRPVIGIPALLGILGIIFALTFELGFPAQKWLEYLIGTFGQWVDTYFFFAPQWLMRLLVNGVVGGVGSILTFIPLLVIFFAAMAFLENVGYMARAAFVMDRFMHIVGLHGKSFLPMCLGFGCNVPSVMGARIVESRKARLLTIFLTPFVPCTGRLAAMTFIAAAVFGRKALVVSWSLVALNIVALGVAGMIISRLFLKGEPVPFIMELPLYHRPDLKTIGLVVWSRTMAFIRKAGSVIMVFSVAIWVLSNVPGGKIETSVLAWIGHKIDFLGAPMGLDWRMIVALLSSIVAKENSIAILGVLYNVGEQGLRSVLPTVITRPSALAFLVMLMIFIPCAPTITVMRHEMENWRWFVFSIIFMFCLSLMAGIGAYHAAPFLGL
ncbi:MAG: ferrous iron transport protein B [Syntrophobacterales bacterium]|jgi:ferrous iron transport protein B|nr:ferrous iron transport protein B [Syntrophobacterales bacterium]